MPKLKVNIPDLLIICGEMIVVVTRLYKDGDFHKKPGYVYEFKV